MSARPTRASPGYGKIIPIMLGIASLWLFATSVPLLDRNTGCRPMDPAVHGIAVDYIEDSTQSEGHVLRVRLFSGDQPFATVTTRDDRPWRTFQPGERLQVLFRSGRDTHGRPTLEYIVDDFAATWGALMARVLGAILCNLAALGALLLGRRRPSAAPRFPPPVPRSA